MSGTLEAAAGVYLLLYLALVFGWGGLVIAAAHRPRIARREEAVFGCLLVATAPIVAVMGVIIMWRIAAELV